MSSSNSSIAVSSACRHVGHFLDGREAFLHQDRRDVLIDIELLHEGLAPASRDSVSLFASASDSVMTFSSQPVSWLARRMFWPPRPMACDSLSSATAMSMLCESSSTTIDMHFGRRHGVDDELRRVLVERNDVDALAGDLVGDRLHARAAHADAGAHRIDARIVAAHGDLGAHARIAGGAEDLDQALADFRHFELEQLDQEFRRGARQEQLRAARLGAHFLQDTP